MSIFKGRRPVLNQPFISGGRRYKVVSIGINIIIGRDYKLESTKSHRDLIVVREKFQ